jgi:cobalt-zinc-cadmium efflux system membrane fusion protein
VQAIKVMPGMKVQKGQVLAVVEDQAFVQLQQDYLTTKQQLTFATKDYQRQKELNASQASSDKSYQLAESEWAKYKITLKALDEKLRLIHINPATLTENSISKSVRILAPISGMVTQVNINIGKYITATDAFLMD